MATVTTCRTEHAARSKGRSSLADGGRGPDFAARMQPATRARLSPLARQVLGLGPFADP